MAVVKISALPSATTPLAGTEIMPVVQSGTTAQVSVQNVANLAATTTTTQSGNYTVLATDSTIFASGTITVTLITAGITSGKTYRIKNIGTGTVTVSSGVNIDTATTFLLSAKQSIDAQYDGTQYWVL